VAFASSLDHVGTLGRSVEDAARLLQVVSGHDPRDATSVARPVPDFVAALGWGVEGLVIGVPEEYMPGTLDPAVRARVEGALARLECAGACVKAVSLPHTANAIPCYYVLALAEAASNLARYEGVRYGARYGGRADAVDIQVMYEETRSRGFGREVKRRLIVGTHVLSAGYYDQYYGAAQKARERITADFRSVFEGGVDVLFTPTAPAPAFPLGERTDDPVQMYLSDVFTVTANLAGVPGVSVPIGRVDGLPVGGQILAPWWEEERMLAVAATLEVALSESDG